MACLFVKGAERHHAMAVLVAVDVHHFALVSTPPEPVTNLQIFRRAKPELRSACRMPNDDHVGRHDVSPFARIAMLD